MGYKKRATPPGKKRSSFTLNITSMTDMFTILLVFLLQTYSTDEVTITPDADVSMPTSDSSKNPIPGLKLIVGKTQFKVEDKVLFDLQDLGIPSSAIDEKDSNFIKPLFAQLEAYNKSIPDSDRTKGRVLLQADGKLPYLTLRKIFYTASMAGFPQLKMITVVGED